MDTFDLRTIAAALVLTLLGTHPTFVRAETLQVPVTENAGLKFLRDCGSLLTADQRVVLDPTISNPESNRMRNVISTEVIGQDEALDVLVDSIQVVLMGMNDPKRPLGRFFFTGPTGVGKTEASKAIIKALGGDPDFHRIRIDCAEFQLGHEVSKLIGATASYAGYGDPPLFHPNELKKRSLKIKDANGKVREITILLVDEIEKANDTVFRLLLGLLDNGRITLGDNTEVNFRNTIVIATSNLGAAEVEKLITERAARLNGMAPETLTEAEKDLTGRVDKEFAQEIGRTYLGAVKTKYTPEFLNRWQKIIQFLHLGPSEFSLILQKQLARIQQRIFESANIKVGFAVDQMVRDIMLAQGTDFRNGARELERTLEFHLTVPIARLMATNQVHDGDVIYVEGRTGQVGSRLSWNIVGRGLERSKLAEFADLTYPGFSLSNVQFDKPTNEGTTAFPTGTATVLENPAVAREVYMKSTKLKPQAISRRDAQGATIEVPMKFVKVGGEVIQLENHRGVIRAQHKAGVPENLKAAFPEDQLDTWTDEQIREIEITVRGKK